MTDLGRTADHPMGHIVEWHSVQAVRAATVHALGSAMAFVGFAVGVRGSLAGWGVFATGLGIAAVAWPPMRRHVLRGDFVRPVARVPGHIAPRFQPEFYIFRPNRWRRMWLRARHRRSTAWIVPATYWISGVAPLFAMLGGSSFTPG